MQKNNKIREKVISLYLKEKTINFISNRLKINKSTVYRYIKLYKKNLYEKKTATRGGGCKSLNSGNEKNIRLHGIRFKVKIYYAKDKYTPDCIKFFESCTINCGKKYLIIDVKKEFIGINVNTCDYMAHLFVMELLKDLEFTLGVFTIKPRFKINVLNTHYAFLDHPVAFDCWKNNKKFSIQSKVDGKTWLIVDNSTGRPELETIHPKTARDDALNLEKHFNSMSNADTKTNKELQEEVNKFYVMHRQSAEMLRNILLTMKSLFPDVDKAKDLDPEVFDNKYIG